MRVRQAVSVACDVGSTIMRVCLRDVCEDHLPRCIIPRDERFVCLFERYDSLVVEQMSPRLPSLVCRESVCECDLPVDIERGYFDRYACQAGDEEAKLLV